MLILAFCNWWDFVNILSRTDHWCFLWVNVSIIFLSGSGKEFALLRISNNLREQHLIGTISNLHDSSISSKNEDHSGTESDFQGVSNSSQFP